MHSNSLKPYLNAIRKAERRKRIPEGRVSMAIKKGLWKHSTQYGSESNVRTDRI